MAVFRQSVRTCVMENLSLLSMALLVIGLLCTGLASGTLAGLLGVGGGIIIVPVLFYLFSAFDFSSAITMHLSVATSLAIIVPTSISSARAHHKKGSVDVDLLKSWGPWIVLGATLGGLGSKVLETNDLLMIFGVIALIMSINLMLPETPVLSKTAPKKTLTTAIVTTPIGFLSALMGIGGGSIAVPVQAMCSIAIHRAVGTAAVFGLFIALPGALAFLWSGLAVEGRPVGSVGYISVPAFLIIGIASVFAAPYGSTLAHKLDALKLRRVFAVFLLLSSINMLYTAWQN